MIYQVHLLIFLFAVVHVFYVWGTLMLTLYQVCAAINRRLSSDASNPARQAPL
jgi:hypothetical protein